MTCVLAITMKLWMVDFKLAFSQNVTGDEPESLSAKGLQILSWHAAVSATASIGVSIEEGAFSQPSHTSTRRFLLLLSSRVSTSTDCLKESSVGWVCPSTPYLFGWNAQKASLGLKSSWKLCCVSYGVYTAVIELWEPKSNTTEVLIASACLCFGIQILRFGYPVIGSHIASNISAINHWISCPDPY